MLWGVFLSLLFWLWVHADLLDTAFQPSKNLDQVVNIGNSKNAVGNEVFRWSTTVVFDLWLVKKCFKPTADSQASCQGKKWVDWSATQSKCYQIPHLTLDENACVAQGGDWVKFSYSESLQNESLLVRVTKTLLRITIALSIPMIIFLGIRIVITAFNGGEYKDQLKNVALVIAGLILALSAIGIIYFIQSLTIQSLSGAPSPF